jgi:hypothetical protein
MFFNLRRDTLMSQHIEVALVYKDMLGLDEAKAYLGREHIPKDIADRVLLTERRRQRPGQPSAAVPAQAPHFQCRRKNRVQDAIVEAALKIERRLGLEMALALLRDEKVPEDVIARVTASGPRQLRVRQESN